MLHGMAANGALSRRSHRRLLLTQKGRCVTEAFLPGANAKFAAADDDNLGAERISEISRRSGGRRPRMKGGLEEGRQDVTYVERNFTFKDKIQHILPVV